MTGLHTIIKIFIWDVELKGISQTFWKHNNPKNKIDIWLHRYSKNGREKWKALME